MTEQRQLKARVRARMDRTGESYATARRHVVAAAPSAGYRLLGGRHPETAAVANALTNLGLTGPADGGPLDEAMVLGIGGGLGAGYILWEFDDGDRRVVTTGFRNRWQYPQKWLPDVCRRLGLETALLETGGAKKAAAQLDEALADGRPVVTSISAADLGHWHLPADQSGWVGYPVVVYRRIDGGFLIDDRNTRPLTIDEESLATARGRISSYRNRLLVIDAPTAPLTSGQLRAAVTAGLADHVEHLSASSASFGLPAFDKWAKMLTASSAKAWPTVFADGRGLLGALVSTVEAVDQVGMLGGNLRDLFADFCRRATTIVGVELGAAAEAYERAGETWQSLVQLVEEVDAIGRVIEVDRIRRAAVALGDEGTGEAREAATRSAALLADDDTGLSQQQRLSLFGAMAEIIGAAADAERAALEEVRQALAP